ncbi:MAG: TOBE domain-containing protein [Pleurocapsa sp.]
MRLELGSLHISLESTMIYVSHDHIEAITLATKIVVLQGGIVEQIGAPMELYHHPRNRFVAGFIGSPKMNFLSVMTTSVRDSGTTLRLPADDTVTEPVQPKTLTVGDRATLGIRPEHLRIDANRPTLMGEVLVVEHLGDATSLYVRAPGGDTIIVQAEGDSKARVGDRIPIYIDGNLCHIFDSNDIAIPRTKPDNFTTGQSHEQLRPIQPFPNSIEQTIDQDRYSSEQN